MWKLCLFIAFCFIGTRSRAQDLEKQIRDLQSEVATLDERRQLLLSEIEELKLARVRRDLRPLLPRLEPGEELVEHSALALVYDEEHEQAKWVAHVIAPDITTGRVTRSNDFRPDPLVASGTAVEKDYFLKYLQPDSTYVYDGYGYDRGHLAPSADFRWSAQALSESYYYSNMSPQLPEFNREIWADLENALRGYLYRNTDCQLYVVTGPYFKPGLTRVVERSANRVAIPDAFWKVVVDLQHERAIGFWMPHEGSQYPLSTFVLPIDSVEARTGIDFYAELPHGLENQLESLADPMPWLPAANIGDKPPFSPVDLPRNHFNTIQAKQYAGQNQEIAVCGTVVAARRSRAGNVLLNLDKQFPDQIFTVFVRKEHLVNFSYDPKEALQGKALCVTGRVIDLGGTPAMFIEKEEKIEYYE